MKYIYKWCHYCWSFLFPKIYFKTNLEKTYFIIFDESVKYDVGDDLMDVNKLFGFGYGLHHIDSDRFGWRYNIEKNQVEIVEYCYEAGKRLSTKHIAWLNIGDQAVMKMTTNIDKENKCRSTEFYYNLNGKEVVYTRKYNMKNKWCIFYGLGLYFGGTSRAPHKISVNMID